MADVYEIADGVDAAFMPLQLVLSNVSQSVIPWHRGTVY
jgi:hypothetical protein